MSAAEWWDIDREPATVPQRRALHVYGYETRLIDQMTKLQASEAIQYAIRVRKLHEMEIARLKRREELDWASPNEQGCPI
jgi:hypothetical protein